MKHWFECLLHKISCQYHLKNTTVHCSAFPIDVYFNAIFIWLNTCRYDIRKILIWFWLGEDSDSQIHLLKYKTETTMCWFKVYRNGWSWLEDILNFDVMVNTVIILKYMGNNIWLSHRKHQGQFSLNKQDGFINFPFVFDIRIINIKMIGVLHWVPN